MTRPSRATAVSSSLTLSDLRFTPATGADRETGLLGFLSLTINCLVVIDGIALRRKLNGELYLAFPKNTDRHGRIHSVVRPADDAIRRAITRLVLAALGLGPTADSGPAAQGQSQ